MKKTKNITKSFTKIYDLYISILSDDRLLSNLILEDWLSSVDGKTNRLANVNMHVIKEPSEYTFIEENVENKKHPEINRVFINTVMLKTNTVPLSKECSEIRTSQKLDLQTNEMDEIEKKKAEDTLAYSDFIIIFVNINEEGVVERINGDYKVKLQKILNMKEVQGERANTIYGSKKKEKDILIFCCDGDKIKTKLEHSPALPTHEVDSPNDDFEVAKTPSFEEIKKVMELDRNIRNELSVRNILVETINGLDDKKKFFENVQKWVKREDEKFWDKIC